MNARASCYATLALTLLALVSGWVYFEIGQLSFLFVYGKGHAERPILLMLGLFGAAFVWYLMAIWTAVSARECRRLVWLIVLGSILFRAVLLWSWPIQEIDIYRYVWDGNVATCGVSPFRYSPEQVLDASPDDELPADLRRLVELRDSSPAMGTVLGRVHYGELPTIYPPVSQAVFAACAACTPGEATVLQRLVVMKSVLVLFDLATLGVVLALLRFTGRHVGWAVVYGWCPLVMKATANDGHLDSVAVFLATLAVWLSLRALFPAEPISRRRVIARAAWGAVVLALAVGAKLYPIVLLPLFGIAWVRRLGWRATFWPAFTFSLLLAVVLSPMVPWDRVYEAKQAPIAQELQPQDPSRGLSTFLRRWEMNDLLFMVVVDNIKPHENTRPKYLPWFSVVPEPWRQRVLDPIVQRTGMKRIEAATLVARVVTLGAFAILALVLAWRSSTAKEPDDWLRAAMLTLAWFWLLLPTQNPWYWIWVLPLVPFARCRAWLVLSGLVLLYYLRFWLGYHWPDEPLLGTRYPGKPFFDYVFVWLEFGPWFVWLAVEAWWRRR